MKNITLCVLKKKLDLVTPFWQPRVVNQPHDKSIFCMAEYNIHESAFNFFLGKITQLFGSITINSSGNFVTIQVNEQD